MQIYTLPLKNTPQLTCISMSSTHLLSHLIFYILALCSVCPLCCKFCQHNCTCPSKGVSHSQSQTCTYICMHSHKCPMHMYVYVTDQIHIGWQACPWQCLRSQNTLHTHTLLHDSETHCQCGRDRKKARFHLLSSTLSLTGALRWCCTGECSYCPAQHTACEVH